MKSVDDCIVLGSLLDHFFNLVVMSNFLPSGMSKLSLKGRGQFHRELQNVCCSKKSRFHVKWYKVFCFGFGLVCFFFFLIVCFCFILLISCSNQEFTLSQSSKELDLHISNDRWLKDKCCAEETGPDTLLFYILTSVEILTKQFTIFGMLMAVKLHQEKDLLLNWQNVNGRNQL